MAVCTGSSLHMNNPQPGLAEASAVAGLVSVVVPVYNRSLLLRAAIGSVLAQTYRPLEIIIVDDGSTDETPQECAALVKQHAEIIRVVRRENGGPGAARETGRQAARGEFIQYLDSDDWIDPEKFERQVSALRQRPDCAVAYCKTREYMLGATRRDVASVRTGEKLATLFPPLLSGRCWQTVTPLFRRTVCDAVGPWSDLRVEEDWEYDARVAALGVKLVWCPEFLADFRHHHGERASGNSLRDQRKMRWRFDAHQRIYQHARRAGIDHREEHMQRFARELFLLARQCGAVGLATEASELFALAQAASGPERAQHRDFRFYRMAATILGWSAAGRLACWADRWRAAPTPPATMQ